MGYNVYDILKKVVASYTRKCKNLKMNFCLWFGIVIIFKDETLNSQWINTLSKFIFIQNKQKKIHVLGKLKAFITKIYKKKSSKIQLHEKNIFVQKDM
jgi:hypothetical protein